MIFFLFLKLVFVCFSYPFFSQPKISKKLLKVAAVVSLHWLGIFSCFATCICAPIGYMSAEHASVYMWEDIAKASFKLGTIEASLHIV